MKNKLLILPILLLISINILAKEGAGHVGGTDQPLSTVAHVRAAFDAVLKDIREKKGFDHPFEIIGLQLQKAERFDDWNFYTEALTPYSPKADHALIRIEEINEELKKYDDILDPIYVELIKERLQLSTVLNENLSLTLDKAKLYSDDRFIFHDKTSCLQVNQHDDHSTRIARVTEFNINGKICISFEALRVIAPYDLKNHIMGVIIHETAHLAGMDENDAEKAEALYHEFSYEVYTRRHITSMNFENQMAQLLSNSLNMLYYANKTIKMSIERSNWQYNDEIIQKVSTAYGMLTGFSHAMPNQNWLDSFNVTFANELPELLKALAPLYSSMSYNMQWFHMQDNQEKIRIGITIDENMNEIIDIAIKCFPKYKNIFEKSRIK